MKEKTESANGGKPESDWLTRHELAAELKVAVRTIDNWTKRRAISATKLGKVVRFRRSQVLADLARYERRAIGA